MNGAARMRAVLRGPLLLAIGAAAWSAHGQEAGGEASEAERDAAVEEPDQAEQADAAAGAPESASENEGAERSEASPEVFTPSENISEDIAVPFPVDI